MFDRTDKKFQKLEVSVGLFIGYLFAGLMNMLIFEKSFQEAFTNDTLLTSFAGVVVSVFLYWKYIKTKQVEEN